MKCCVILNVRKQLKRSKSMIEYAKVILPKVSFSRDLFRKELAKCVNWVEPEELVNLQDWCKENFGEMYPKILTDVFSTNAA